MDSIESVFFANSELPADLNKTLISMKSLYRLHFHWHAAIEECKVIILLRPDVAEVLHDAMIGWLDGL